MTPASYVLDDEQQTNDPPSPTTLITLDQVEHFSAVEVSTERIARLQNALGVNDYPANSRICAWVEFCFGVLNFALDDAGLTPEKSLRLLTLAHEVYVFATEPTPVAVNSSASVLPEPSIIDFHDNAVTEVTTPEVTFPASSSAYPAVESVYDLFREKIRAASTAITKHQVTSSTIGSLTTVFAPIEVKQIVAFLTSTFFRHLRAYQYLSRVPRQDVSRECPLPIETPHPPPPLVDAVLQSE